jgi:hypothetical protein
MARRLLTVERYGGVGSPVVHDSSRRKRSVWREAASTVFCAFLGEREVSEAMCPVLTIRQNNSAPDGNT